MAYWTEYKSGGHRGFKLVASNSYELMYLSKTFSQLKNRWALRLTAFGVTGNPILDAPLPLSADPVAIKEWAVQQFEGKLLEVSSALQADWLCFSLATFGPCDSTGLFCKDSKGNIVAGISPKGDTCWSIYISCLHGFGIEDLFPYEEYPSPTEVLSAIRPAMKQRIGFLQFEINNIQHW